MNFIWVADFDRRFGIAPTPGNIKTDTTL